MHGADRVCFHFEWHTWGKGVGPMRKRVLSVA